MFIKTYLPAHKQELKIIAGVVCASRTCIQYSMEQVEVLRMLGRRGSITNGPTYSILWDCSTMNASIGDLIKILVKAKLYAAANYLHDDILCLGPVPQDLPYQEHQVAQDLLKRENNTTYSIVQPCLHSNYLHMNEVTENNVSCKLLPAVGSYARKNMHTLHGFTLDPGLGDTGQEFSYQVLTTVTDNFNCNTVNQGGHLLASGEFGDVYLGLFNDGLKIAIKRLQPSAQRNMAQIGKDFANEIKMLTEYKHKNLIHLLGYCKDCPFPCLVYEYLSNGSLEDQLSSAHGMPPLLAHTRVHIVKGSASGIVFLNDNNFVHRDIKSANILLDFDFNAKIADVSMAILAPSGDSLMAEHTSVVVGTSVYIAPEAYEFDISTKLDSYSFGIVLLEVITGLPSFNLSREERNLDSHIMENIEPSGDILRFADRAAGVWTPRELKTLFDISVRCLTRSNKQRPNVKDFHAELEAL